LVIVSSLIGILIDIRVIHIQLNVGIICFEICFCFRNSVYCIDLSGNDIQIIRYFLGISGYWSIFSKETFQFQQFIFITIQFFCILFISNNCSKLRAFLMKSNSTTLLVSLSKMKAFFQAENSGDSLLETF
jgi:hypothetical protein